MSFNKRMLSAGAGPFVNSQNFGALLYTGDDSSGRAITGLGFQPDFVWVKPRNQNENHTLHDSTRGSTNQLASNSASPAREQGNTIQSFDADGFTVNGDNNINKNGINYVAFCWRANGGTTSTNTDGSINSTVQTNANSSFSIIAWTGDGNAGATIGHNLGATPDMFIVKKRSSGNTNWRTYHKDSHPSAPEDYNLEINGLTPAEDRTEWNDTAPTSSVFSVSSHDSVNENGSDYICYAFKSIDGFTKFGSYEGNSSDEGPIVETGFEPAFLMIKNTDDNGSWFMYDNKRSTSNPRKEYVLANATNAEASDMGGVDFLSNGFQIKEDHDDVNDTGDTYIYMAFAADPDEEAPTLTSSFNIETYTGTGNDPLAINGLGFSPGFVWIKVTDAAREHILSDIVRGPNKELSTNSTDAEESRGVKSFDSDGFTLDDSTSNYNHNGENYVAWTWKANDNEPTYNTNGSINSIVSANDNAGFSIVSYTGDGNSARTVGHGLSAKCDLVIIKNRDSTDKWPAQLPQLGDNARMVLEGTAGKTDDSTTAQAGNATVFGIGGDNAVNKSGDRFIAYCFRNITGYQKIGTYTGDGQTDQTITTGFKPDFIVIKSTVGNANWRVYDTKRTIEGGFIRIHTTGAPHTDSDTPNIEIISTGFKITSGGVNNGVNANGNVYFYWAIAKNVPSNTTLANSFRAVTYTGNQSANSITGVGFRPDLVWIKERSGTDRHVWIDSLRGLDSQLSSNNTDAQTTYQSNFDGFDSDGFTLGDATETNGNGETYVAWCWKAGNQWQSNVDGTQASLVNANNVHFPTGWFNTSGIIYDLSGNIPNCTRLYIWNIADNSLLKASYLSVSGSHPKDAGYHGPSGIWLNQFSGAPSSTPDTSAISILDFYGKIENASSNPFTMGHTSATFQNLGPFRLYFSTDPVVNWLVSDDHTASGYLKQVFSQGYQASANSFAANTDIFNCSSENFSVLRRDDITRNIVPSGFYYASEMMYSPETVKCVLDESAANAFANAKHNAVNKSNLAKVVHILYPYTDGHRVGTDSGGSWTDDDARPGLGLASVNYFDLEKNN